MNLNLELPKLLHRPFNALDILIEDYEVYLHLVFVWLALAVIAWILSGGLRRRMKGNSTTVIPCIFVMPGPPMPSPSPIIDIEVEQAWSDDDETTE
jgi:hypothetical protein